MKVPTEVEVGCSTVVGRGLSHTGPRKPGLTHVKLKVNLKEQRRKVTKFSFSKPDITVINEQKQMFDYVYHMFQRL